MRWIIPDTNPELIDRLSQELALPHLIARLLIQRGITEPEQAHQFLNPRLTHLHDPFLMRDMAAAVDRLRRAIASQEKILIYGDYDVDGATAVVVLLTALRALGAKVESYIPNRFTDGYGMRASVVEQAARDGVRVIISVDTGIREHEALERMRNLGINGIVTDHHLPEDRLPPACAILNPRRPDCEYPEKNLAGVGVAFKLAQALLGPRLSEAALRSYLKVVAIGSIADVVPLTGENRVIAHFGLEGLTQSSMAAGGAKTAVAALLAVAGLEGKPISASDVAFRIAPRLNAAGRMDSASDVIELFTGPSDRAPEIAARLDQLNRDRQRAEDGIIRQIEQQAAAGLSERRSLVFAGKGWNRGVIGIAAQRVVDLYYRPALVISIEDDSAHGSARSIRGFHLLDALTRCGHLFSRFGGHAQAAGFSLPACRIQQLEAEFETHARSMLTAADLSRQICVDAEMGLEDLSWGVYAALKQLEPFGCGNPTPVFSASAELAFSPRLLKEKHLKLSVQSSGRRFDAIGWNLANRVQPLRRDGRVTMAFSLGENTFQGRTDLQLVLKDIREA